MKHNSEIISDDNGIEILVGYEYERSQGYYEETGNASTWIEGTTYTELKSVEVVMAHKGIDILPIMSLVQKTFIISKLTYQ